MEIAAFTLSLFSVGLSVLFFIIERILDYKNNVTNLRSEYFKELYASYMLKDIPLARRPIRFDDQNRLKNVEELQKVMDSMLEDSMFYKYSDPNYYNALKKNIEDLEDYLLRKGNEQSRYEDSRASILSEIENKVEIIYKCMNEKLEKG